MRWLSYKALAMAGWGFAGSPPDEPKWIAVGAPHTSNWDFFVYLAALHHYGVDAAFLGKHTLFRWPLGPVLRALGGIPVDRSRAGGVVRQVADAFERSERMVLVLAPEGTRGAAPWWRSGFLKIAEAASVPVVFAGIDYPTRSVTLGEAIWFDGDVGSLMDRARGFYSDMRGRNPGLESAVALRDETVGG